MNLRDGRRGQRLETEILKDCFPRLSVSALDDRPRLLAGERRHLILQFGQFQGDVVGQQIAPGGQHLAELDENRPQILQRQPDASAARQIEMVAGQPVPRQQMAQEPDRSEQMGGEDDLV